MIIINVDGNIEKALKQYKRKVSKIKQVEELRKKQQFTKQSVTCRDQFKKAKYKQHIKTQLDRD